MSESATAEQLDETPAQEVKEVPESAKPISLNRFGVALEKRNEFVVHAKQGADPELCLEPKFWEHIARHLGRGDIVEIVSDDLAWELSVRVIDKGHNWAHVKKRHFIDYGGAVEIQSELPQNYKVDWAGQTDKFRVIFNGEPLKVGFANEAFAHQYARNHAQSLKR